MNQGFVKSLDLSKWLVVTAALGLSTPAYSEYYLAADAAYMDAKTLFANGTTRFELTTARIKFGQRVDEYGLGWEVHAIAPTDDTGPFTGGGVDKYELRGGLGIMLTASTPRRGLYGGIGFTQILSDYSVLDNTGATLVSTTTSHPFTTINVGAQYPIGDRTRITFDYTFYHGDINCNFCTSPSLPAGTFLTDPDVRLSTFALGLSYSF